MEENIVVTLNNNEKYVLVDQIFINNDEYLYLQNLDKETDKIFGKLSGKHLKRVTDESTLTKLLIELSKKYKKN